VIPVRSGGDPTPSLETLKNQSFKNFEVIISRDPARRGASWARNRGAEAARAGQILFSDDDIRWYPDALQKLRDGLEADPGASWAWGSYYLDGHYILSRDHWDPDYLRIRNYISTNSLIRREHFPGFDEHLRRHQDWDLWLTMLELGRRGTYVGDLFETTIKPGDISSGAEIDLAQSRRRVLAKHQPFQVDLIIPTYLINTDLEQLALRCLTSIRRWTSHYRIIVVDNGSRLKRKLRAAVAQHRARYLIENETNLGFVKAINQGLKVSTAPYVVLLNDDVEVTSRWLEKLLFPFRKDPRVGLAGPRTDAALSWQGREKPGAGYQILDPGSMLAFFCVCLRRELLEEIGFLDEDFGLGLGDDDDYCLRAERAGWKLAFVRSSFVHHRHRATFHALFDPADVHEMQLRAVELLKEKHCQR